MEHPDSGQVDFDGVSLVDIDEHHAGALGIGMVHQERSLVPGLSVAENIFAGHQPEFFKNLQCGTESAILVQRRELFTY